MLVSEAQRLNIPALLAEIPGASARGDEHAYLRNWRETLFALRKAETPRDEADTGYRRAPDWDALRTQSELALATQTKDIRLVGHLVEATTQLHGFSGLADSLSLLVQFVVQCWDRCNPPIDDGDLDARTVPLENMLDDEERGMCFPNTIRRLPLLGNAAKPCSFFDYQQLKKQPADQAEPLLASILEATDPDEFTQRTIDVEDSLQRLTDLKQVLGEKIGDHTPGFTYLRTALLDCRRVLKAHLADLLPSTTVDTAATESSGVDACSSQTPCDSADMTVSGHQPIHRERVASDLPTRDEVYRQLADAAEYLRKIEPHSPIPYLVKRAVELGQLEFPELVTRLVREDSILNELRREFGITQVDAEVT
jgi:type VI secretion system protein ImpA